MLLCSDPQIIFVLFTHYCFQMLCNWRTKNSLRPFNSCILNVCEYGEHGLNVHLPHVYVKAPAAHSVHISISHLHKRLWAEDRPSTRDSEQAEQKKEEEKESLWHFTFQWPQAEPGALCHNVGQGSLQNFLLSASRLHDVMLLIHTSTSVLINMLTPATQRWANN